MAGGFRLLSFLLVIVSYLALLPQSGHAQFIQSWQRQTVNQMTMFFWRPTTSSPLKEVINPQAGTFLEYNCFYMPAICQNARNYINSAVGKARTFQTIFSYDFDSTRGKKRRRRACPSGRQGWKSHHACPEPNQPKAWRSDGQWPETKLEANPLNANFREVSGYTDNTGQYQRSGLQYSCDEFPPAQWVEGGVGTPGQSVQPEGDGAASQTICAAIRICIKGQGTASEQNWQGALHSRLSHLLVQQFTNSRNTAPVSGDAAMFGIRLVNDPNNGIAGRVTYFGPNGAIVGPEQALFRRDGSNGDLDYLHWLNTVRLDELEGLHEDVVYANATLPDDEFEFMDEDDDDDQTLDAADAFGSHLRAAGNASSLYSAAPAASEPALAAASTPPPVQFWNAGGLKKVVRRNSTEPIGGDGDGPLLKNATQADIERARKLVAGAIVQMAKHNKARIENPARNQYKLAPGTSFGGSRSAKQKFARPAAGSDDPAPPPLFDVTAEIAAAAALVAEADAAGVGSGLSNLTRRALPHPIRKRGTFWMEGITRRGTVPWGGDPSYKVFRNVRDYGAAGDGVRDDTAAIRGAMMDGSRCGENCNGATVNNAVVYFPPGTYLVSGTIQVVYGTQMIGDANDRPTILAAASFVGLGVLSTDEYVPGGGIGADGKDMEWYINTASFYRQIRNFKIDVTRTAPNAQVCGIHYQIAQATSLQFVEIVAQTGTTQQGMFSENGSGGVMADVTFTGGKFGFYGGNQQFTAQRLTFNGCETAVHINWDWGWVWKSITVTDAQTGFNLLNDGGDGNIGSCSFLDSQFTNVGTAIQIAPPSSTPGSGTTGLILENVGLSGVTKAVADSSGNTLLFGVAHVEAWAIGPVHDGSGRTFAMGRDVTPYPRVEALLDTRNGLANAPYFERPKPQYEGNSVSDFVSLKASGAMGDGVTDDTLAFQTALNQNVGKIIFVDAGTYILTGTVSVPSGTRLVGETWSQFAAKGSYFGDASNPKVMLRVGEKGEFGSVEMQDLLFTTQGATPGAILVEWNIKASNQGSAGLWDCHVRIGGATGTELTPAECPALPGGVTPGCQAASAMMHITKGASGYFENMWLWVADHMIDDPLLDDNNNDMEQVTIYVARGILIESQDATWLYGTASEHATYYQYNFHNARNIFAGMVQTESPYYQPVPAAPLPFSVEAGVMAGDPNYSNCMSGSGGGDFDGCDSSWAVIIEGSQDIFVAGAGLYSWFDSYTQDCIDSHECQKALVLLKNNYLNVRLQHLITIGAKYMVVSEGNGVLATDNLAIEAHPAWSQISVFDAVSNHERHISPESATIIPLPHTTVGPQATLTLTGPISSDVAILPNNGNQNDAPGPGANVCQECSFFRLLTSTCCGTGGSVANPIEISPNVPTPLDIPLPAGFVPNQDFTDADGANHPAGVALPGETIVPRGTVFTEPFTIPAGQPLRGGEEPSDGDEFIWINPTIWESPSPTVTCFIPCTFVLPPWKGATSTIDFPRVTVTEGDWTSTITKPPMTITSWGFEPELVSPTSTSTTTSDSGLVIIWPTFSPTTTWPPITYSDDKGSTHKTRPTSPARPGPPPPHPPHPPPKGSWPPPVVVIHGPPGPKVNPCFFPALTCPPGSGGNSGGRGRTTGPDDPPRDPDPGDDRDPDDDDDNDDDNDDEEEEEICLLDTEEDGKDGGDNGGGDVGVGDDVGGDPTPTPTPTMTPDTQGNSLDCYNHGHALNRSPLLDAASTFCAGGVVAEPTWTPGQFLEWHLEPSGLVFGVDVVLSVEVKTERGAGGAECRWVAGQDECMRYFAAVVDGCDCGGVGGKHGGVIENNCLKLRIDPNVAK